MQGSLGTPGTRESLISFGTLCWICIRVRVGVGFSKSNKSKLNLGSGYFAVDGNLPSETILP